MNHIDNEKEKKKKLNWSQLFFYTCLALSLVTTLTLFVYTIIVSSNIKEQLSSILQTGLIAVLAIFLLFTALSTDKKGKVYALLAAITLTFFSGYQLLEKTNILNLPTQKTIEDFSGKDFIDAVTFASSNKISLTQIYENSDIIENYHIINQNVKAGTLVKNVKDLTVTISEGPDLFKEVVVPSMIGWNADDVLSFIKKNYLANVEVSFILSDEKKDTVIEQIGTGNMKRNDLITLTFSIGTNDDITDFEMKDLKGLSTFEAIFYLKRQGVAYETTYAYSNNLKKGLVISNDKKGEMVNPRTDKIVLTISKGREILVPDLLSMNMEDIAKWISENNLKIKFTDRYDELIKEGMVITSNIKKDAIIEEGTLIEVVISKGSLKMTSFKTVAAFKEWADKYHITYNENYEFSDNIGSGDIIKFSHKEGDVIKNGDSVTITISEGKEVSVPNFIGKSKDNIKSICKDKGLTCTFVYGRYSDDVKRDIATSQSKNEGSKISSTSSISITLSKGPQAKVNVPNFNGKYQNEITAICNNLGLTCTFTTNPNFSDSDDAGRAINQSVSGTVLSNSKVNITLSRGKRRSCSIVIQENWFGVTFNQTKNNLIKNLSSCSNVGVTFNYQGSPSNEGSGIISPNSPIKAGLHTFYEGNTYTIIINE